MSRSEALWLGEVRLGPWLLHPLVLVFAASGAMPLSSSPRVVAA